MPSGVTGPQERNLKVVLEYDGTDFAGFQIQPAVRTVQGELEAAFARLTKRPVRVHGAGRTDAGVHAMGQVVSLRIACSIPDDRVPEAMNRLLPLDLAVRSAETVDGGFHARYSAKGKVYEYRLLRTGQRSPLRGRFAFRPRYWPDIAAMHEAVQCLVGEHDFSGFAAAGGKADDTVREVTRAAWTPTDEGAVFRIEGTGFLYKMVRNIVGMSLEIGAGRRPEGDMERVLISRDRRTAASTASACGLCLIEVVY